MKELWVEKYRPKTVDGYVFRDDNQRKQVQEWIKQGSIPHLLLSGSPGIGKTTLAKLLLNELEIPEYDVLEINASRERGIGEVRERITNFIQMMPFGPFKVVLLDEADMLTPEAQAAMRGVMEEYHTTARFILTCNYPNKIIPPLHSRCQGFHITKTDQTEFTARVATVLVEEGVEFDLDTLDSYVKATYPDLRKCLNLVQLNSQSGKLNPPGLSDKSARDWKLECVDLFKKGQVRSARNMICQNSTPEEAEDIFRWMYDNLGIWSSTESGQDDAILIIRKGLVNHSMVADPEVNLSATIVELTQIEQ